MSKPLTIVSAIHARQGKEDEVARRLAALVGPSRRDPGCLQYDLHRALDDPAAFVFLEQWETRRNWRAHMETPHLKEWQEAAGDLVEKADLMLLEKQD